MPLSNMLAGNQPRSCCVLQLLMLHTCNLYASHPETVSLDRKAVGQCIVTLTAWLFIAVSASALSAVLRVKMLTAFNKCASQVYTYTQV